MELSREKPSKASPPSDVPKLKRFRVIKLEDRIAPAKPATPPGQVTRGYCTNLCGVTHSCAGRSY